MKPKGFGLSPSSVVRINSFKSNGQQSARCSSAVFSKVLAARKTNMITALAPQKMVLVWSQMLAKSIQYPYLVSTRSTSNRKLLVWSRVIDAAGKLSLVISWKFARYTARIHWLFCNLMTTTIQLFPTKTHERLILRNMWRQRVTLQCYPLTFDLLNAYVVLHITITSLMTVPSRNSWKFCFPRIPMFPETEVEGNIDWTRGKSL